MTPLTHNNVSRSEVAIEKPAVGLKVESDFDTDQFPVQFNLKVLWGDFCLITDPRNQYFLGESIAGNSPDNNDIVGSQTDESSRMRLFQVKMELVETPSDFNLIKSRSCCGPAGLS